MDVRKKLQSCGRKNFIRYFVPVLYGDPSEVQRIMVADGFDPDSAEAIRSCIKAIEREGKAMEAWEAIDFDKIKGMGFGEGSKAKTIVTIEELLAK